MYTVADVLDMVANSKDYETQGNIYCGNLLHTFFYNGSASYVHAQHLAGGSNMVISRYFHPYSDNPKMVGGSTVSSSQKWIMGITRTPYV